MMMMMEVGNMANEACSMLQCLRSDPDADLEPDCAGGDYKCYHVWHNRLERIHLNRCRALKHLRAPEQSHRQMLPLGEDKIVFE